MNTRKFANLNDERVNSGLRAEYLTGLVADLQADIEEAKRVELAQQRR